MSTVTQYIRSSVAPTSQLRTTLHKGIVKQRTTQRKFLCPTYRSSSDYGHSKPFSLLYFFLHCVAAGYFVCSDTGTCWWSRRWYEWGRTFGRRLSAYVTLCDTLATYPTVPFHFILGEWICWSVVSIFTLQFSGFLVVPKYNFYASKHMLKVNPQRTDCFLPSACFIYEAIEKNFIKSRVSESTFEAVGRI
jgi:hypothetical protein